MSNHFYRLKYILIYGCKYSRPSYRVKKPAEKIIYGKTAKVKHFLNMVLQKERLL